MGRRQQSSLGEMRSDELQSHRQRIDVAAGQRHAGQSRQIRADRVNVVQIHGHRIIHLRPDVERRRGRGRPDDEVDLGKGGAKIIGDETPYPLRLQIIRIEIPGGQHIGARHDAPLDFRAEALAA